MALTIEERVARELKVSLNQTKSVLGLLDEGCTVPFIARYRKEATGSLDETVVTAIRDRHEKIQELEGADFKLESVEGKGTKIEIMIPEDQRCEQYL